MKAAAIEKATLAKKVGCHVTSAAGEDAYRHVYPATRADIFSRTDLKEYLQDYFQTSRNVLARLEKSLEAKWSDGLADALEDDWSTYRAERGFIGKLFGLCVNTDDEGHVKISSDTDDIYGCELCWTRADVINRHVLMGSFEDHFQTAYKILTVLGRRNDRKWDDQLVEAVENGWHKYHVESYFIRKLFGLRVDVDDSGRVTVKGICE